MGDCDTYKNPLQHSGTNQNQRILPGLQPDYVKIDEHDYADWIVFAAEFSKYVQLVDLNGLKTSDWSPFFASDISAVLGSAAVQNVEVYREKIKFLFDEIKASDSLSTAAKVNLYHLFSALFTLAQGFDRLYWQLPDSTNTTQTVANSIYQSGHLKITLGNLVKNKLKPAIERLLLYYDEAESPYEFTTNAIYDLNFSDWKVFGLPVQPAVKIIHGKGIGEIWWKESHASWSDYYQDICDRPNPLLFKSASKDNLLKAANHNLFFSVFDVFTQVYQKVVTIAENDLLVTLEEWPQHAPHYALFLTFLQLFQKNVDHLNGLTQRHLDFYYKEILHFSPKPASSNQVHVLLALSKTATSNALPKGTLFKAGKDSLGKEICYELDRETTFNKAKVAQLKSIYFGNEIDSYTYSKNSINYDVDNNGRLFASPIANSADGIGGKLTTQAQEWPIFTSYQFENEALKDVLAPNASIGFAVASYYLLCGEGQRTIRFRLKTSNNNAFLGLQYTVSLTTEDGWFRVEPSNVSIQNAVMSNEESCVEFVLSLSGNDPEILSYDAEVHGQTYLVDLPVLRIELSNSDETPYPYNDLKNIILHSFELHVEVGEQGSDYSQKGLKNLLITADTGMVDPSKPFLPFGAQPQIGGSLVIGAREAFLKPNTRMSLHFEWNGIVQSPSDMDYNAIGGYTPNVQLEFLQGGEWILKKSNGSDLPYFELFDSNAGAMLSTFTKEIPANWISDGVFINYKEEYSAYSAASTSGFLRLTLNEDFGHKDYLKDYTAYLIDKANKVTPAPSEPIEPYTPVLKSVYISYQASTGEIKLDDEESKENPKGRFYHIYPFGETEQHISLLEQTTDVNVLPQFTHTDDKPESTDEGPVQSKKHDHIGEFYIGLENLAPQESVNILFQVMEGTTDPLVSKPEYHVAWSYLSKNEWMNFKDEEIEDNTLQLIRSGIIAFTIPSGATSTNTILPGGYIWLRASVCEATGALAKLISVQAQAALLTFKNQDNAPDVMAYPLAASCIGKLKTPLAWVKKVLQPYSSFGGRAEEKSEQFYTRVSERLRHRDRASTIWDYEHLVLEAFPNIYKVKCLNHTKIEDKPGTTEKFYNENQPGYVTIITIPSLVNRNDTDKLKPYTHHSTLEEIKAFLSARISAHVNLIVENPLFEEAKTEFNLKLKSGYPNFTYYAKLLQEEITQFLSPWLSDNAAEIEFGGELYKSTLIDFIEERPYVDFITDMKLRHQKNEALGFSEDMEKISASTARSILVSAPASKHEIAEYEGETIEENQVCDTPE